MYNKTKNVSPPPTSRCGDTQSHTTYIIFKLRDGLLADKSIQIYANSNVCLPTMVNDICTQFFIINIILNHSLPPATL